VVDDEEVIAQTLAVILRQSGFLAKSFTNPLEALAEAASTAPDLLISDVMMPEMSGVDLAIKLRALHPECKVLAVFRTSCNDRPSSSRSGTGT
jgi:CheY-like chemotaxis protein